jgi:hypothetical protein
LSGEKIILETRGRICPEEGLEIKLKTVEEILKET